MSVELTVTDEGKLVLSPQVLAPLGVRPGDRVAVDVIPTGVLLMRAAPVLPREEGKRPISATFGALKREGQRALTVEEIREIADAGWAGER